MAKQGPPAPVSQPRVSSTRLPTPLGAIWGNDLSLIIMYSWAASWFPFCDFWYTFMGVRGNLGLRDSLKPRNRVSQQGPIEVTLGTSLLLAHSASKARARSPSGPNHPCKETKVLEMLWCFPHRVVPFSPLPRLPPRLIPATLPTHVSILKNHFCFPGFSLFIFSRDVLKGFMGPQLLIRMWC